jgi:hypothetical protein
VGAFAVIYLGAKILYDFFRLKKTGTEVPATVTSIKRVFGKDAATSFPVVTYKTKQNITITKSSHLGFTPGFYKANQNITVMYDEKKPEFFMIKDNFTIAAGLFMILVGLFILVFNILHFK